MTEGVLIKVELPNAEENNKRIDELTRDIIGLSDANKELAKTNADLAKAGQKNTQEYVNNAKQIEINKQKIQENSASRKGLIQTIIAEDNSIKGLRVQNAELIKQRDLLNTKTKEGQAAIKQINAQLDNNNKVIRENSSQLEKQKINIGNYASALDNVVPGLGGFATGLTNLVNPITAVSAGVGALVALYAKSTIGTKDLEFASNQLSSTINVLGNNFAKLFSSSEDGEGFFSQLSFGLLSKIDIAAASLGRLSALNQEKLEDLNRDAKAALTEQQNLLEDNADILEKVADSQTIFNDKLYLSNTAIDNIRNGAEKVRLVREQELAVLEQQLSIDSANEAIQDAILEKKLQIAQEARREEKLVNNIQKLQSNLADSENKRLEAISKIAEKEANIVKHKEQQINLQSQIDTGIALSEARAATEEEISLGLINMTLNTDQLSASIAKKNKATEDGIKASNAALKSDKERTQGLMILSNALGGASAAFKDHTIASKVLSAAQAGINSFLAGTAVLADPALFGRPFIRIPLMIATVAAGLAQQAKIISSFALGGILKKFSVGGIADSGGVLSGPSHALGGIPFSVGGRVGFEAEGGEAIINKRSTALYRRELSAINEAGGGRSFAMGGIPANETRIATQQAQSQFDMNQMASLMNMVQVVLVREDFETKQMEHNQTINRAKVV
jgi:hypothetical protein